MLKKNKIVDRLKDIINKRINEHMEKFTNFTMMFCWKVKNDEYSITIVKEEVPCLTGLNPNQELLEHIIKMLFNQINIDNFEEFCLVFVSSLKSTTYRYNMNRPMEMIVRKMLRRFFERGVRYRYRWLPDSVFNSKLDSISRFRAPYGSGSRSHYLELPIM